MLIDMADMEAKGAPRSEDFIPAVKKRKHEDSAESACATEVREIQRERALVSPHVNRELKKARIDASTDQHLALKSAKVEEIDHNDPMKQLQDLLSPTDHRLHYKPVKKLGKGAYGEVYRAINKATSEEVAIKKMSMRTNPKLLLAEVLHLNQSVHDNIPRFMDIFMVNTNIWLVMESIKGLDVAKLVEYTKVVTTSEIACVCHGVVSALKYLHSKHIIHRDIKGQNILISQYGGVYVADFGLSIVERPVMEKGAGTVPFIAPEVLSTTTYGCNVDIWSLGMTIFHMSTRKIPYFGYSKQRMRESIMNKIYPNLDEYKMPSAMSDFLNLCLEWDSSCRASSEVLMDHEFLSSKNDELVATLGKIPPTLF